MGVFDKRVAFKPFEYPEVMGFVDAINHSYWIFSEFNLISDIQDFHTRLSPKEKNAIKNALLAISQIEVSVKSFWGRLDQRFPKPEFNAVGVSFGEAEVRHERAYSHLLEVLGFNDEFEQLLTNPVIMGRVDYLTKYIKGAAEASHQHYTLALTLFSLFVENVSLFSQFALVKAFNKERNMLKGVDNIIQATLKEEALHSQFGIYLVNKIKDENPEWFNDEFYRAVRRAADKAFVAEVKILDWIFEDGELDFLPKLVLVEFIKHRFNDSLGAIGAERHFQVDESQLTQLGWFIEELYASTHTDFFNKKSVNYAKNTQSITADDLF